MKTKVSALIAVGLIALSGSVRVHADRPVISYLPLIFKQAQAPRGPIYRFFIYEGKKAIGDATFHCDKIANGTHICFGNLNLGQYGSVEIQGEYDVVGRLPVTGGNQLMQGQHGELEMGNWLDQKSITSQINFSPAVQRPAGE